MGGVMSVLYLSRLKDYNTLSVDVTNEGATIAAFGLDAAAFVEIELTDDERLLLAASLLRDKEVVSRTSDGTAIVQYKGGKYD
jgi:hypothetical protein